MIGNGLAWGRSGYTIIEHGELQRDTLELRVDYYLVAGPDGRPVAGRFKTLTAAKRFVEQQEASSS